MSICDKDYSATYQTFFMREPPKQPERIMSMEISVPFDFGGMGLVNTQEINEQAARWAAQEGYESYEGPFISLTWQYGEICNIDIVIRTTEPAADYQRRLDQYAREVKEYERWHKTNRQQIEEHQEKLAATQKRADREREVARQSKIAKLERQLARLRAQATKNRR